MIDIHSHILPGVDDGSSGIEESIRMAELYLENGIDKVIVTPHYIEGTDSTTLDENKVVLENLKRVLKKKNLDLKLYLGNEIYVSPDTLSHITNRKAATLNETKYVLVELPMHDIPMYMKNTIYELSLKGYIPIIAHPERNTKIQENPNILYEFIEGGALAQLNLPSIEGRYGSRPKEIGEILLAHNMIHFVGTDAHSTRTRSPKVEKSLGILKEIVDKDTSERITYLNGKALLEDKLICVDEPVRYEEKKGFFSMLKSKINLF